MANKFLDSEFLEAMKSNTGCAIILAGSGSDEEHIAKISAALKKYDIPHRSMVFSAHKQAEEVCRLIDELNAAGGSVAIIAVAGSTDALSGILSFHALYPVISCPPDGINMSCLTNPPKSSNVFVKRPDNAARFVAQMYAGANPKLRKKLEDEKKAKLGSLKEDNAKINKLYRR